MIAHWLLILLALLLSWTSPSLAVQSNLRGSSTPEAIEVVLRKVSKNGAILLVGTLRIKYGTNDYSPSWGVTGNILWQYGNLIRRQGGQERDDRWFESRTTGFKYTTYKTSNGLSLPWAVQWLDSGLFFSQGNTAAQSLGGITLNPADAQSFWKAMPGCPAVDNCKRSPVTVLFKIVS